MPVALFMALPPATYGIVLAIGGLAAGVALGYRAKSWGVFFLWAGLAAISMLMVITAGDGTGEANDRNLEDLDY